MQRHQLEHTFGYYAHGVGPDTATLPDGWRERLVPVRNQNTGSGTGLCLETHDLAVSKLIAGREKDLAFIAALLRHGLTSGQVIQHRLAETQLNASHRELCAARLKRLFA